MPNKCVLSQIRNGPVATTYPKPVYRAESADPSGVSKAQERESESLVCCQPGLWYYLVT